MNLLDAALTITVVSNAIKFPVTSPSTLPVTLPVTSPTESPINLVFAVIMFAVIFPFVTAILPVSTLISESVTVNDVALIGAGVVNPIFVPSIFPPSILTNVSVDVPSTCRFLPTSRSTLIIASLMLSAENCKSPVTCISLN